MHKVLADSVRFLLRHLARCGSDELPLMLSLVRERKALIEKELQFERMLIPDIATLPPLLKNLYSLEFMFEETEVVREYSRLLESLYEAEQSVLGRIDHDSGRLLETLGEVEQSILQKIEDQNTDGPASDL
jgi:hypothetical protein